MSSSETSSSSKALAAFSIGCTSSHNLHCKATHSDIISGRSVKQPHVLPFCLWSGCRSLGPPAVLCFQNPCPQTTNPNKNPTPMVKRTFGLQLEGGVSGRVFPALTDRSRVSSAYTPCRATLMVSLVLNTIVCT